MKKRKVRAYILIGLALGLFVIQPLAISLHMYDMQGDNGNWWKYLLASYQQEVSSWDLDQAIIKLLFGLLGIALALMFMVRQKIFQLTTKSNKLEEIKELIGAGENQQVEFKSTLRWDLRQFKPNKALEDVVAKTIAGFMNTQGGHLFIGINDNGNSLGLQEDYASLKKPGRDRFVQYVMQLVSTKLGINYCALVGMSFYQIEGLDVCHLEIKRAHSPVYLHQDDRSHFYIRTGNGTRELDIPEALNYIEENLNSR
ncbi:ATP-binding protein [Algoriphagus sp. AGSA1]|uniref:AlbA family DNA-binding domain-containing protein n=1 Tax=Algoriphagus sp. AGSA1 TaxID=2907213 RepID=UPI001F19EB69|nr:ATP-binding protein [Algoriphagus sp. AGSA1]MCE7056498.1 ATP-binding protein [Algoriphagus sp. AGSA1]|tara:strand:- start:605 stop:1372 length:768 start_codon:yes stop_codon:yes gene_type:complete